MQEGKLLNRRSAAAVIAALTWLSVLRMFYKQSNGLSEIAVGVSYMSTYYSCLAAIFVAALFSLVALDFPQFSRRKVIGHAIVVLTIMMVMYWFFRGLHHFRRFDAGAMYVHAVLFPLVVWYWLAFRCDQGVSWKHVWQWTLFPLIYTIYALVRGYLTGDFAYPQANFQRHGVLYVAGMLMLTLMLAIGCGSLLLFWDRRSNSLPHRAAALPVSGKA